MAPTQNSDRQINFGLIFFSSSEAPFKGDKYHLVLESVKFADSHGFSSVWIPERHFTRDGWLYPNPAILLSALARETKSIRLNAGSVVMPLHDPIRLAEEWSMVDNLSGGRVGISFASGWHPNDFVFFPEKYANRQEEMYRGIQTVQKLWRGESIQATGGDGKMVEIRTFPTPLQTELPIWVTAAGNPKTFIGAGEMGAGVLTHLYNHSIEELGEKLQLYREARATHGYDPETGHIAVMMHTFVAELSGAEQQQAHASFRAYLKSASYLFNAVAYSRGQNVDLSTLSEQDFNDYLDFVLDRLVTSQRVLFGTPESCLETVRKLRAIGVSEIACQMDFGIESDLVLKSLPYLNMLRERSNKEPVSSLLTASSTHHEQVNVGEVTREQVNDRNTSANTHVAQSRKQAGDKLNDIQERCTEKVSIPTFYERLSTLGVQLASRFQGIEQLWRRDGEALGRIKLPSSLTQDAQSYQVHPSLLDACFQTLIPALPQKAITKGSEVLYLPTGLRSFRLHERPGHQVWSHARLTLNRAEEEGLCEGDVRILDDQGNLLIEATGLQLRRSEPVTSTRHKIVEQAELKDWLYELQWEPQAVESFRQASVTQPGTWLVFMDGSGISQRITELLAERGDTCIKVFAGTDYQVHDRDSYILHPASPEQMRRLIEEVFRSNEHSWRGVLHLWSLDMTPLEETSLTSLEADQSLGTVSALNLVQAFIAEQRAEMPRTWFVTGGAQAVQTVRAPLAVAQSPLWGLGRTWAIEHPELWGGLIDIDPQESVDVTASQLFNVMSRQHAEDQIAFRNGEAYVARLVRSREWEAEPLTLRADASYLITGGLWGLGLEVARWLAERGARHLLLLGRTRLPLRSEWDTIPAESRLARQVAGIRTLEGLGAHVHYASVDVTDEAQMKAFLNDVHRQHLPPVRGIIHAASVWQDQEGQSLVRPLANLDSNALREVFRPKVLGSWLLYKLFQETPLDFFVSFSSGASLFGSAAQGNYAAAGAFLDALAHHLRALGRPALSIDWGAVSETGFGATSAGVRVHEYWESHGIYRITPQQVLNALELLVQQHVAQVGVLRLNWDELQQFYPQMADLPLLSYLTSRSVQTQPEDSATAEQGQALRQTLLGAPREERRRLLETYLSEQVARVLRLPLERLDAEQPLTALGLDSLMAIELKNRIERELGVRISIVTFLQGPSIHQFVGQLLDQLAAEPVLATFSVSASSVSKTIQHQYEIQPDLAIDQRQAQQILAHIDQMPEDQVDALLGAMLQMNGNGNTASEQPSQQEAAILLQQLDQLSDQEVDSLLSQIVQEEGI